MADDWWKSKSETSFDHFCSGAPAELHTHIGKKRKHMASGVARGRVGTTATTTTMSCNMAAILQICIWFTVYFFDIGHPCYDQLTCVKSRCPLTSITCPYHCLKPLRSRVLSWRPIKRWFSIGLRARARLTCWKQGRIARTGLFGSRVTLSGLKVNFFSCFVLCMWWLLKLKTEGQTIYRKPHCKVKTFLGGLMGLRTTRPRSCAFRLA